MEAKILGNSPVSAEMFFMQNRIASEACPFEVQTNNGMTIRQQYAGLAMSGLCANYWFKTTDPAETAKLAVDLADALLEELTKINE